MTKYPKKRNGKFRSGFWLPHIIDEENKVVWVRIQSSITAMGMSAFKKRYFPNYELKIPTPEYWEELKKKFNYKE
tara:strand:- start:255 stop:479 length:225 start_codon:yes stop_codon:yes gene_type:complete